MEDITPPLTADEMNAGYLNHLSALQSAFPGGEFQVVVRCNFGESAPGRGDRRIAYFNLAGSDPDTAIAALKQSFSEEAQRQLAFEREQAVAQAQKFAQRPKLIMPGQLHTDQPAKRFQFD